VHPDNLDVHLLPCISTESSSSQALCCSREASRGEAQGGGGSTGTALVAALDVPSRSETLNFIRLHSPDGDYDLLPGIILFTERWLAQVSPPPPPPPTARPPPPPPHTHTITHAPPIMPGFFLSLACCQCYWLLIAIILWEAIYV